MEIAKIRIVGAKAYVLFQRRIPAGLVGGYISVEYSGPEWDGLSKTAVFRGAVTRDVINAGETVVIPHEAVKAPGIVLEVGFYGSNTDGTVVIPTFWANLGVVGPAADPSGDESTNPVLPVWGQILAMIGDLSDLDTQGKENLVAAINEVLTVADSYYTMEITQVDAQTIAISFVGTREGMPEIPGKTFTLPAGPKGDKGDQGEKGDDYVLTDDDMQDIAGMVMSTEEIAKMQQDIADLKYVPIAITSISNNVGTVEKGVKVTEMTVSWAVNKTPTSQTVDGTAVDVSARSKVVDMTGKTSVKVVVTDERGNKSEKSTGYSSYNGVYYGVMDDGADINSAAILALSKKLQSGRGLTFTANPGENQRIAYALPVSYGTPGFKDADTGFQMDMYLATEEGIAFANAQGYTESYNVWLSTNIITNSKKIAVT